MKRLDEGVRLRVEDEDDLWTLAQICGQGSRVGMLSHRRDSTTGTQPEGRAKSAERKPMWILLDVQEASFQTFTDNLRVHGVINEARIDIGSHHTHIIGPGDEVEVTRDGGLSRTDKALLDEAFAAGVRANCGLTVVESDEVMIFEVSRHGIRDVSQFNMRGGGKKANDSTAVRRDFFEKVARETRLVFDGSVPLIICGPGLARERFERDLLESGYEGKILNVATSIGGRSAANEVLTDGLADDILGSIALIKQVRGIEEGLKRVATEGAVAYGLSAITEASGQGAIETLIIDASKLRSIGCDSAKWDSIANEVMGSGGEVVQASIDHDAGQQLLGLGGAIALLRWKVQ
ncbi:MAG TPA: hypothetical protein QF703_01940 [Candidatus Thalassarchaeaceae archaeon]|nr:hypothetical protein [Candidatus Thalassarchaeaceae archaeon]